MALGGIALPPAILRAGPSRLPETETVCDRMAAMDKWRRETLMGYSGMRRYTLSHGSDTNCAEMLVKVEYSYPGRKTFQVISKNRSGPVQERIFHRVMDAELEVTRDEIRDNARIGPRNYEFAVLGADRIEGRSAYIMRAMPRRKRWFLVDGKIWVDAEDAAVTRIEGEVPSNSFWVKRIHTIQSYSRIGQHWLMTSSENDADVRFLGPGQMKIECFDYRLRTA